MTNKQNFELLRMATRKASTAEANELSIKTGLDYRTVIGLVKILKYANLSEEEQAVAKYTDPSTYTLENVKKLYEAGLSDIIPFEYFENEAFVREMGITEIPAGFLAGCTGITEFKILPQIEKISDYAFYDCKNLRCLSVDQGELKEIGNNAFRGCTNLAITEIPESVEIIGKNAFRNCESIVTLKLPENIIHIKAGTFQNCFSLTELTTAKELYVGHCAFYNCSNLVAIGAVIREIGESSFGRCLSLKGIKLCTTTVPGKAFDGCALLQHIVFIMTPFVIGSNAFRGCISVEKIAARGLQHNLMSCTGYEEMIDCILSGPRRWRGGGLSVACEDNFCKIEERLDLCE